MNFQYLPIEPGTMGKYWKHEPETDCETVTCGKGKCQELENKYLTR